MHTAMYVVIPSHNRAELTIRTLESLASCMLPTSYSGAVVIENGTKSENLERHILGIDSRYKVSYRHTSNGNKSLALNLVIEELPDDGLIVFFDDDIIIHPYALTAYADAADKYSEASFFGGPFLPDYADEIPPGWLRRYMPASVSGWSLGPRLKVVRNGNFMGCNWAARQRDVARAGRFNPSYGPGSTSGVRGQETAMQRDLLELGSVGVYVPNALVWHHIPGKRCSAEWISRRTYALSKTRAKYLFEKDRWLLGRELCRKVLTLIPIAMTSAVMKRFVSERRSFWISLHLQSSLGFFSGVRFALRSKKSQTRLK